MVYILDKYSADIEITGFVTFDEIFPPSAKPTEWLDTVRESGFILDRQRAFEILPGLSLNIYKKQKSEIHQALLSAGFERKSVKYRKPDYKKGKNHYFVCDEEKLVRHLQDQGYTNIQIVQEP